MEVQAVSDLTAAERRLYEALYSADGAVVAESELLAILVGEREYNRSDRTDLRSFIYHMRRKGVEITNVKGVGYQLGSTRCPTCGTERRR